ncbi:hypothetical protein ABT160_35405 [Streptomyces sp. NPDC001941]|uniref:hypothetical protein n=1 Tax=Streptomyces sp. NPDC001941 TaxID=3154659 RepID=UPI00331DEA16
MSPNSRRLTVTLSVLLAVSASTGSAVASAPLPVASEAAHASAAPRPGDLIKALRAEAEETMGLVQLACDLDLVDGRFVERAVAALRENTAPLTRSPDGNKVLDGVTASLERHKNDGLCSSRAAQEAIKSELMKNVGVSTAMKFKKELERDIPAARQALRGFNDALRDLISDEIDTPAVSIGLHLDL